MKCYLAQLHILTATIQANCEQICQHIIQASRKHCDLCVFPELSLFGYPATDQLFQPNKQQALKKAFSEILKLSTMHPNLGICLGLPEEIPHKAKFYNSLVIIENGRIVYTYRKTLLANDDVFDEARYFFSGKEPNLLEYKGLKLGFSICEDMWFDNKQAYYQAKQNPLNPLQNADVVFNLSASPYEQNKANQRYLLAKSLCKANKASFVYLNQVGMCDEILFDGSSFVLNAAGETCYQAPSFEADFKIIDLKQLIPCKQPTEGLYDSVSKAICFGLKQYCQQTGHSHCVVGLSGGIDSSLVAALATKALGAAHVTGIRMPSKYSSAGSLDDAAALAHNLGIKYDTIGIETLHNEFVQVYENNIKSKITGLGDENIQSRIRGDLLMLYANNTGALVLPTSNKSEIALGYATLYGDMCGALSLIGDLYKTQVYELAKHLNKEQNVIPNACLTKAPSAELRPNQTDQDSLPNYKQLDTFLKGFLEDHADIQSLVSQSGLSKKRIIQLIESLHKQEFKRKQSSPILKLSKKAFGKGRLHPILSSGF